MAFGLPNHSPRALQTLQIFLISSLITLSMMKNRTILCLPKEVLQNVADHLPPLDAIRLTQTSHHFYSQLQLHTTSSLQLMKNFVRRDRNDLIHYAFEIPILNDVIFVHTLWVCMNWRDQGFISCFGPARPTNSSDLFDLITLSMMKNSC